MQHQSECVMTHAGSSGHCSMCVSSAATIISGSAVLQIMLLQCLVSLAACWVRLATGERRNCCMASCSLQWTQSPRLMQLGALSQSTDLLEAHSIQFHAVREKAIKLNFWFPKSHELAFPWKSQWAIHFPHYTLTLKLTRLLWTFSRIRPMFWFLVLMQSSWSLRIFSLRRSCWAVFITTIWGMEIVVSRLSQLPLGFINPNWLQCQRIESSAASADDGSKKDTHRERNVVLSLILWTRTPPIKYSIRWNWVT